MELNKIEQLLEKYLEGETSLNEEQLLQEFFNSKHVPSHLLSYQPLFNYFMTAKTEVYTKNLPLKSTTSAVYKWFGVAAAILISAGVFFNWSVSNADLGTYKKDETQLAYNQFVESMQMVSKNFNQGTSQVNYLQAINTAQDQVKYLNELQNPIGRIIIVKK
jgi:hypothetical protein